jgi:hypothetical protein
MTQAQELVAEMTRLIRQMDEAADDIHAGLGQVSRELTQKLCYEAEALGVPADVVWRRMRGIQDARGEAAQRFGAATADMDVMRDHVKALSAEIDAAVRERARKVGRRSI